MTVRKWGGETLVNTNVNGDQEGSTVAALTGGGYVISWFDQDAAGGDGDGISTKFQLYDAAGNKVGAETIANADAAGSQSNGRVAATDGGGFVIVWRDSSSNHLEYRRFDADGTALDVADDALAFNTPRESVAPLGTGFAIALEDLGDIRVQRFLANGDPTGAVIDVATSANDERAPAIAELAAGGFVVAWEDSTANDIFIRIFDAGGSPTTAAVHVDGAADSSLEDAIVTALANGSFVVAWRNINPIFPDTSGSIRARIVTANGVLIGSEFTVNTQTDNEQTHAALAALPNGGFVAVYSSGNNIHGQVFDAFGARDGGEFVVNSSTDGLQAFPTVAALADGRFVVTWSDNGVIGADPDDPIPNAIRQQIFDPRDGVVTGTDNGETLFGHDLGNDEINGLGGADTLNGLGGADNLYGGDGDDTFVAGTGDSVFEFSGGGTDLVQATVSFALGANVENLTLTGAAAINGTGNVAVNTITGNAAANVLSGLGGADTMLGLAGNDSYVVDNVLDTVSEAGGGGTDAVISSVNFSLVASAHVIGAFERLTLTGGAAITGTGNNAANIITGNNAANVLNGGIGNDTLKGLNGNDTLIGGVGIDTLTGGLNNDSFVFNAPLSAANRDIVTDFNHVNDVIRLENAVMSALGGAGALKSSFFFAGAVAHDPDDHVIYNKATGALFFDSNGFAAGGVTQLATLTNRPANVDASDFVVI